MRNLLLSLVALGSLASPAIARPVAPALSDHGVQRAQYYEPGWREREEWRARREAHRRQEWLRAREWREEHEYRRPPPPRYYGPRY